MLKVACMQWLKPVGHWFGMFGSQNHAIEPPTPEEHMLPVSWHVAEVACRLSSIVAQQKLEVPQSVASSQ